MEEKKIDLTYEQAVSELEGIIGKLESGESTLDESISMYSRGMELSKFCKEKLDDIVKRINMLGEDGKSETPFTE